MAKLVERLDEASTAHGIEISAHVDDKYQCQDSAGNWTTGRPPDHRKETQTAVVWSCLPFIRSGQNHLARHSERGEKTGQTEKKVGRQHPG